MSVGLPLTSILSLNNWQCVWLRNYCGWLQSKVVTGTGTIFFRTVKRFRPTSGCQENNTAGGVRWRVVQVYGLVDARRKVLRRGLEFDRKWWLCFTHKFFPFLSFFFLLFCFPFNKHVTLFLIPSFFQSNNSWMIEDFKNFRYLRYMCYLEFEIRKTVWVFVELRKFLIKCHYLCRFQITHE